MGIIKDIVTKSDSEKTRLEMQALTTQLRKLNQSFSWQRSLVRGIVSGFGTAIGAGLLVAVAAIIFEHLTGLPLLGQLFGFLAGNLPGGR